MSRCLNYGTGDVHTCAMQMEPCALQGIKANTKNPAAGDWNPTIISRDHEDPFSLLQVYVLYLRHAGTTVAASFRRPSSRVDVLRWPIAPPIFECRLRRHGRSLRRFIMEVDINDTGRVCLFGEKWWETIFVERSFDKLAILGWGSFSVEGFFVTWRTPSPFNMAWAPG